MWQRGGGDRIPVGGASFPAPVQTGPGAHPAFYTMATVSFPEVKRSGRGVVHPPPFSAEIKERVRLYLYSPSGPSHTHHSGVGMWKHNAQKNHSKFGRKNQFIYSAFPQHIYQPYRISTGCPVGPKHVVELIMNK